MADKTFTALSNPGWESSLVDGLFKWTDAGAGVVNQGVYLKADGPPIEVGRAGATANFIGVLASAPAQNDICKVRTKYTAIYAFTAGATVTRGAYVKFDAAFKVIDMVGGDFATGAAFGGKAGQALQSAALNDIIYVGLGG